MWLGAFVCNAARNYGVEAVGITVSRELGDYARRRVGAEALGVAVRVQDYRDVHDGPYDAIASIGMSEHVGQAMLPTCSARLLALLRPGGRLHNHALLPPRLARRFLAYLVHRPLRLPRQGAPAVGCDHRRA